MRSFDARLEAIERTVAKLENPSQLTDFESSVLYHEIGLILFVTPITELPKLQPFLNKVRKSWGLIVLEKYIRKMVWTEDGIEGKIEGKFVDQLTPDQLYFLLKGKEKGKS